MDKKTQTVLTMDMEWVVVGEIWENVANQFWVEELKLTTKDIADYNELMQIRMKALKENDIKMSQIYQVIENMNPFDWAVDFLDWARKKLQVIVLTDSFWEFTSCLTKKLNYPTIFCHTLQIQNDKIINYNIRTTDHKTKMVKALKEMNFFVLATWDSFNDVWMLKNADKWIFFSPSPKTYQQFPELGAVYDYDQLKNWISENYI